MTEESPKTFFSYARADSAFVLRLVKDLRAAGADVWLDQLDIDPGEHWDSAVENALRVCPRHVTVLSPEAVSSQNVMDEVSYALEEHKQVIPLLYRDCIVPFRLRRVQWVDFRTDYASGFRDLARALGIKGAPAVPAAPIVEPIEQTQATTDKVSQTVEAAAQPTLMPEQPRREGTTGEAERLEEGRREEVGVAVLPPRIWPEPKKLWIAGVVVVVLVLVIWMMSGGKGEHDSGASQGITPTATPTPDADGDAKSFYWRGADLYDRHQYDQAIDAFNNAIQLKPDYAEAFFRRGDAYDEKGQYDEAITDYDQALRLQPDYADAFHYRGLAYQHKKQYDLAIKDYNQALKLNPNDAYAYNSRGSVYQNRGDYDLAIQDYNQALNLDSNLADAYYNRGLAYEQRGQYARALQDFDQYLKVDPNDADANASRTRVAAKLKK